MKIISAQQINASLDFPSLIDQLDRGFARPFSMPQRQVYHLDPAAASKDAFALLPSWNDDLIAVKAFTYFPHNSDTNRSVLHAALLLFNRSHGEPVAQLDGMALTLWRTAAVSALAARHLANPDATRLLLLGTGQLAPHLLHAHLTRPGIDTVSIWGRNSHKAAQLAETMNRHYPHINFNSVVEIETAAAQSDIIVAATGSPTPLVRGHWLRPGTHVDLLGNHSADQRECDTELVCNARVFVDSRLNVLKEAGEILIPMAEGKLQASAIVGELAELCNGTVEGRRSLHEITLFKSVGTAISDLLTAQLVIEKLDK